MINRLPRWVWIGGCILAFVGGMVNVVTLLSFTRFPTSHMTGNVSELGIYVARSNATGAGTTAEIILSFFVGAIFSGWLIQDNVLRLGRRYSAALCVEALLLAVAVEFLKKHSIAGLCLCASACGLQNAMASTYSGAIVRTTHMTGVVTDLGVLLGQKLRGMPLDTRRLSLFVLLIGGYTTGGIGGSLLYQVLGYGTLFLPVTAALAIAILYALPRKIRSTENASVIDPPNVR